MLAAAIAAYTAPDAAATSTASAAAAGGASDEPKEGGPQPTTAEEDAPQEEAASMLPNEEDEETHDSFWHATGDDEEAAAAEGEVAMEEDSNGVGAVAGSYGDAGGWVPVEAADDDDNGLVADTEHVAQAGDLTAAFFSEMSAANEEASRARKRRRGQDPDADSDEEYGMAQRRAFHIPAHLLAKYDPASTAEPQSAEEYLMRVRLEADACPNVKRSDIDPRAFEHKQTAYMPHLVKASRPANAACLPSEEWTRNFAAQFAEARQGLLCFAAQNNHLRRLPRQAGLPAKNDPTGWISYCLGKTPSSSSSSSTPPAPVSLPHCPSLALMVSLEQVEVKAILMQLLTFGADEITRRQKRGEKLLRAQAEAAETESPPPVVPPPQAAFPSHSYAMWLYTLLLKVDKPVPEALAGDMRHAYRRVSWLRAHDNRPDSEAVKYANIVLTLCDHFGQRVEM